MHDKESLSANLKQFISTNLNAQQQAAVQHTSGSVLVVAGAGSGKTRVITARIAHLMITHKIPASAIIALTFTNKAAQEMHQRIGAFLAPGTPLPFVGTFHAYCLRLLKQYTSLLEQPFITLLDAEDARTIIDGIIKRNNLQKIVTSKSIQHQISLYKNQLLTPNSPSNVSRNDQLLLDIYGAYEQEKIINKCLDFDDLLLQILRIFKKNNEFRTHFHATVRHILVDEYQDTNAVQHELLKYMAKNDHGLAVDSLCAVGDEDQSIYSWRGATVSNIMNFNKDFLHTTIIKIEQNYRSNQAILDTANSLINHNTKRTPKKLWSAKKGSDRVRRIICNSEYQEADALALFIACVQKQKPTHSYAVLYRAHFQSRIIEEALIKNSIPYTIIGGIHFYERKEIKDLLAYARLACNPHDRISFLRAINCPPRGLGEKCIELFYHHWNQDRDKTCIEIGEKLHEQGLVSGVKAHSLMQFLAIIKEIKSSHSPLEAFEHIIQSTGFFLYIQKNTDQNEAKERIDNVKELLRAVQYMQDQGTTTLAAFLDEVSLMQDRRDEHTENGNPVYLMTLHAAKGLEFDTVMLTGLEEGILPSSRSHEPEAIEEERRLLYVGITRAQEYLVLSHCLNRYTYGTLSPQRGSRFLDELPENVIVGTKLAHMSSYEIRTYFTTWLSGIATPMQSSSITVIKAPKPASIHLASTASPVQKNARNKWKQNQIVRHQQFGLGMITAIDEGSTSGLYVTVKFKSGTKKIAAQFLQDA